MINEQRTGRALLLVCAALGLAGTGVEALELPKARHGEHPQASAAEETDEAHEAAGEHGEPAEEFAGHAVHVEHKNGLGLFLGGTIETAENETFRTIGLEYERLLADRWAVQVVVEHVNDFDAWVVIAPVGFRLGGRLWALAGPGLETEARRQGMDAPDAEHHGDEDSVEPHAEGGGGAFFLWRFGLIYGIHLGESGRFGLFPSVSLDLVREHGEWVQAWVFGVGLSYHF